MCQFVCLCMLNTEPVRVSHSVRAHPHVPKTIRIRRTKRVNGPTENTGLLRVLSTYCSIRSIRSGKIISGF